MKTYVVRHGNRFLGTVNAFNAEHAMREAAYEFRKWTGGYVVSLTITQQ